MSVKDDASDFRDGRGERSSFEKKKKSLLCIKIYIWEIAYWSYNINIKHGWVPKLSKQRPEFKMVSSASV